MTTIICLFASIPAVLFIVWLYLLLSRLTKGSSKTASISYANTQELKEYAVYALFIACWVLFIIGFCLHNFM